MKMEFVIIYEEFYVYYIENWFIKIIYIIIDAKFYFMAFFDDSQVMILCILLHQAEYFLKFSYFLVDLSFKRVQRNIKELGFNGYDENHNASKKIRIIFFLKIGFFN